jgi:hypothetical protein
MIKAAIHSGHKFHSNDSADLSRLDLFAEWTRSFEGGEIGERTLTLDLVNEWLIYKAPRLVGRFFCR